MLREISCNILECCVGFRRSHTTFQNVSWDPTQYSGMCRRIPRNILEVLCVYAMLLEHRAEEVRTRKLESGVRLALVLVLALHCESAKASKARNVSDYVVLRVTFARR